MNENVPYFDDEMEVTEQTDVKPRAAEEIASIYGDISKTAVTHIDEKHKRKNKLATDAKKDNRRLGITDTVPCHKNGLIKSRNGEYCTHSDFRKRPATKAGHKKVRQATKPSMDDDRCATSKGNMHQKLYDDEWA